MSNEIDKGDHVMALFQKVSCAECGKQFGGLLKTKLKDGEYLCSDCMRIVPTFMHNTFFASYTLEGFRALKSYVEISNQEFKPRFSETASYYSIHIDEDSALFYLGKKISEDTIFFKFSNVDSFDLDFNAKELKEGILGDKVTGDILFELEMAVPRFEHEEKLSTGVKTKARKKFFGTKVVYDPPEGMLEFSARFQNTWLLSAEDDYDEIDADEPSSSSLQQAMTLFMLDSLEGVTLEEIKTLRNRLMSTFHPDKGSDADVRFAQKINEAYEELKKHIK